MNRLKVGLKRFQFQILGGETEQNQSSEPERTSLILGDLSFRQPARYGLLD
jgi:hypothetical protein